MKSLEINPAGAAAIGEQPGATGFPIGTEVMTAYDYVRLREPWLLEIFFDPISSLHAITLAADKVATLFAISPTMKIAVVDGDTAVAMRAYPRYVWDATSVDYNGTPQSDCSPLGRSA